MPEFIDPVFAKTIPKRSFSMTENEHFGLVFAKTGSINSGSKYAGDVDGSRRAGRRTHGSHDDGHGRHVRQITNSTFSPILSSSCFCSRVLLLRNKVLSFTHRLNMELVYLGFMGTAVLVAWLKPRYSPLLLHLGTYKRALLHMGQPI